MMIGIRWILQLLQEEWILLTTLSSEMKFFFLFIQRFKISQQRFIVFGIHILFIIIKFISQYLICRTVINNTVNHFFLLLEIKSRALHVLSTCPATEKLPFCYSFYIFVRFLIFSKKQFLIFKILFIFAYIYYLFKNQFIDTFQGYIVITLIIGTLYLQ